MSDNENIASIKAKADTISKLVNDIHTNNRLISNSSIIRDNLIRRRHRVNLALASAEAVPRSSSRLVATSTTERTAP
jgi:hypothetical protein